MSTVTVPHAEGTGTAAVAAGVPEELVPFKGLLPFTAADAPYFFGRRDDVRILLANLKGTRLTVAYGPSGVGKTSIIRAGMATKAAERSAAEAALGPLRRDPKGSLRSAFGEPGLTGR